MRQISKTTGRVDTHIRKPAATQVPELSQDSFLLNNFRL